MYKHLCDNDVLTTLKDALISAASIAVTNLSYFANPPSLSVIDIAFQVHHQQVHLHFVFLCSLSIFLPTYLSTYLSLTHHTLIPFSSIQQAEHVRNKKRAFHDMPEALVLLQRKNKSPLYRIQEQVAEQNCCFQVSQYT